MNTLPVIKQGCIDAIEEEAEDVPAWRAAYISVVDPQSVLEMTAIIEELLAHADKSAPELAARVREAIGVPSPVSP